VEWHRENFTVTCDPAKIDAGVVSTFLASSYWAKGIPEQTVAKSLANSLCFALLDGDQQVGFAKVISDRATIAYLNDVFVLPEYRGRGLAKWMMECVLSHPELQGLRRWVLATRDAHGFYKQFGFTALSKPEVFMELLDPNVYGGA
jgi:N-acetylglutamate synthase-like GNAT family acetyltransferase